MNTQKHYIESRLSDQFRMQPLGSRNLRTGPVDPLEGHFDTRSPRVSTPAWRMTSVDTVPSALGTNVSVFSHIGA